MSSGVKQNGSSEFNWKDMPGSTSPHSHHDASSLLKSNCVIALRSLSTGAEGNFYAVRCLVAGVWSLQMQAGLQPYDPSVQLVVLNQNGKLSFRSAIADGRLLCCNRQYHLSFEHWEGDCQEAWSLQGSSLSNCTLRNEMYRLTLNVRITVLAEPTDLLGNPGITSALMTTTCSGASPTVASALSAKGGAEHQDIKSSNEALRRFLVKPGSNRKVLNLFTHNKERLNPQELQRLSTDLPKTKPTSTFTSSDNPHMSKKSPLTKPGMFTFSSSVKTDSPQISARASQDCTEGRRPDSHRVSVNGNAIDWKPGTPTRNECQLSTFSFSAGFSAVESQTGAKIEEQNGNCVLDNGISPRSASISETSRKVRKWKRNIEGTDKAASGDFGGNFRSIGGLKRSQEPLFMDNVDENGILSTSDNSDVSTPARSEGQPPRVVIKRQPSRNHFEISPKMPYCDPEGTATEKGREQLKYSESQLKAALDSLSNDTARQEKEKVVHWKLQAAVHLLKTETQQNLTLVAKAAFEEAYIRAFQDKIKRSNWFMKDVREKKSVSSKSQRDMAPATTNIPAYQNKLQWTYSSKRVSAVKEAAALQTLSNKRRKSSSSLQVLLKLWFFLPVPLLSLAYLRASSIESSVLPSGCEHKWLDVPRQRTRTIVWRNSAHGLMLWIVLHKV
ncbi:hypothetical protein R1flu_020460 [Riccia fluitans]|uniref:Uncharacterized protein n=1 Tax=Riccia fluitans TaxID=41844 RepID=A0ABD1ZM08_9MARC